MSFIDNQETPELNKENRIKKSWEAPVLVTLDPIETAGGKPYTLGEGGGVTGAYGAS